MSREPRAPTTPSMSTLAASGSEDSVPPVARFEPGTEIAKRYRIVRFIAAGGMGEVYEAEDLELGESVALKMLRSHRAGGRAAEYFRREILLARKVTHPNVCRLFDFGTHGELMFLTMELLRGDTLAERIHEKERLTPAEALPIVRQLADALGAAHEAGVIHRDFKSANVMLVGASGGWGPDELGSAGRGDSSPRVVRAVVTDFGLARTTEGPQLTERGNLAGTLAYMAPEQVEAGPITPRTDIYALGVVLFEMITGDLPFDGPTPLLAATRRLTERAPSARSKVPELDRRWERAIARCLERDPANRFQRAADVVAALEGPDVRPRRLGPTLLIAALLALAAGIGWYAARHRPADHGTPRRAVAILGFQNRSGAHDAEWMSTALGEMMASELAAGDHLRLVAGEVVARARRELSIADADGLAADTLARIHGNIGADYVVLGSYLVAGQRVRVDLRLQDARSGETLDALRDDAGTDQLFELVTRVGTHLRQKLGTSAVSTTEARAVRAETPQNAEAARLYAEGLAHLAAFDALGARAPLEAATRAEPDFPLAHAALSRALGQLGEDRRAADEAKLAFDRAQGLPQRDLLHVEARLCETTKNWARAAEIYRSLFTVFPDSLDDGLGLARVLTAAGKGKDALAVVAELRRLPPPAGADPRIDLACARGFESMDDFAHEQTAAAQAVTRGRATGARMLVAEALLLDSWASRKLGDEPRGLRDLDEARALSEALGDRRGVAWARHHLANALQDRSDLPSALREEEAVLEIAQSTGDRKQETAALGTIGNILSDMGRLEDALKRYQRESQLCHDNGDRNEENGALLNLGITLSRIGRPADGRKMIEPTLLYFREVGNQYAEAIALLSLADALREEKKLAESRARLDEAIARLQKLGDRQDLVAAQTLLGAVLSAQGDRDGARKQLDEAIAICKQLSLDKNGAEALRERARLLWADGRRDEAIADVREAAERLAKAGAADEEALARALLGHFTHDPRELARAKALAQKTENAEVRAEVLGR